MMSSQLYRTLYRIRRLEEEIARIYPSDRIKSPVHLSIGQEAVSVGVCAALEPRDVVFGTYRGHALYLAKGGDMRQMVAELFGKVTGCTRGKGGSMHLIDVQHGIMGMSAVVGTTIANATGYAYALKQKWHRDIVVSFFGDGATEEGVFSESLNFAVLKKLPILFVCENNGYAIHTPLSKRQGNPAICDRARSFGMPAEQLDGNNLAVLVERASEVVAKVRAGAGPWFFEVLTYRWREHVGPGIDDHLNYRDPQEAQSWQRSDPLPQLATRLCAHEREVIERDVEEEISEALLYAESSPFPSGKELLCDVFKE